MIVDKRSERQHPPASPADLISTLQTEVFLLGMQEEVSKDNRSTSFCRLRQPGYWCRTYRTVQYVFNTPKSVSAKYSTIIARTGSFFSKKETR
jgi:hypothetical protein